MKRLWQTLGATLAFALAGWAQTEPSPAFALPRFATAETVKLTDFAGKIVVLDWFTWWCPYCQAAAPQLLAGIDEWYATRSGNPAGIPVVHVGVNLQPGQETQTQNFVTKARLEVVLQDFSRTLANRIATDGQPIFAIINGVTNSPSHQPWELLYSRRGYGQTTFPVADFRSAIDAVKAPPARPPPAAGWPLQVCRPGRSRPHLPPGIFGRPRALEPGDDPDPDAAKHRGGTGSHSDAPGPFLPGRDSLNRTFPAGPQGWPMRNRCPAVRMNNAPSVTA